MRNRAGRTVVAVVAAVFLIAAACGSDPAAVDTASVDLTPRELWDPAPATGGGLEYGDSLDEVSEAEPAGAVTDPEASTPADDESRPDEASEYTTIEWNDLVAPGFDVADIWARYEDRLDGLVDGTPEANALYDEMLAEYESVASANPALDGAQIELAGFVTPLTYEGVGISEFLLVPYFGACIHAPPPPPNQVVMVNLDVGMDFEDSFGPVWVNGTLSVATAETDLATASYTLTGGTSRVYS